MKPEKLNLESMNIPDHKKQLLKEAFPEVFGEGDKVDFEKLKAALGEQVEQPGKERFGLSWAGKSKLIQIIQEQSRGTLRPAKEESVDWDTTENVFIEGDNLEVLKLLQKSYLGKIKMIYIDPPYNTGKDFVYPDDFSDSLKNYFEITGQTDSEGKKITANPESSGRYHSNWLNMMYPRLFLARNLLSDDGVIFISIDDNEIANLRKICDDIYGEDNFIACIIWQKKQSPQNDASYFSAMHDYILVYAKMAKVNRSATMGFERYLFPREEEQNMRYSNPDNDMRGPWASVDCTCNKTSIERPNLYYPIINPKSKKEILPSTQRVWRYEKKSMQILLKENRIWWGEDGNNFPRQKRFLSEVQGGIVPSTWWEREFASDNQTARREIRSLFKEGEGDFDTPKPTRLISRMMQLSMKDDIVLDFFAGSCTTAHAVLDLNKEDGSSRKYIMVQLPEPYSEDSESFKAGYKTIADIGKERIRRVIKTIKKEKKGKLDLEDNRQDLGFRVYKLDTSSFKQWQAKTDDGEKAVADKIDMFVDPFIQKRTPEDILAEIMLKSGFELSVKIEEQKIGKKKIYSVSDGALLIYLEDEITEDIIKAVAEKEPHQFICLDVAFHKRDDLKANAVLTFKSRKNADGTPKTIFKTV